MTGSALTGYLNPEKMFLKVGAPEIQVRDDGVRCIVVERLIKVNVPRDGVRFAIDESIVEVR